MQQPPAMLWVTLVEAYLARLQTRRVSDPHVAGVRRILLRFTRECNLWDQRIDQVSQNELQSYAHSRSLVLWRPRGSKIAAKPLTPKTINNEIAVLNGIFSYCGPRLNYRGHRENLGLLAQPPYCNPLDEPDPLPVSVTDEQMIAFIGATKHATSPQKSVCDPEQFWLAVLVLDSITALRRGALLSIVRPDDATFLGKRQLSYTTDQAKNKRAEIVTLGTRDDIAALLYSLPSKPGEPLLPWRWPSGKPLSLDHFDFTMRAFQAAAGSTQPLKTKHLRSTAATVILTEQFSTDVARKKLAHRSDNVIIRNYLARVVSPADNSATDFLGKRVMDLLGKQQGERTSVN